MLPTGLYGNKSAGSSLLHSSPRPPTDTHLTVSPPSSLLMRPVPHASPLEVTAAKKTQKQKDFLRKQLKKTGYQTTAVLMLLKSSLFTAKDSLQKFGAWRTGGPSRNPTS